MLTRVYWRGGESGGWDRFLEQLTGLSSGNKIYSTTVLVKKITFGILFRKALSGVVTSLLENGEQ
jgi:hypothetical protein